MVHLLGLEDFQRESAAFRLPKRLSIAAGNSVLEWTLIPKLAELRKDALPGTLLEFYSERTGATVARLIDMTLGILGSFAKTR